MVVGALCVTLTSLCREILQFAVILLELTKNKSKKLNKKTLSKIQKPKRKRQRTTPEQLIILEEVFNTNNTPDQQTRQKLADELGMSSRRVQIWFQNKRAKLKRVGSQSQSTVENSPTRNTSSPLSAPEQLSDRNADHNVAESISSSISSLLDHKPSSVKEIYHKDSCASSALSSFENHRSYHGFSNPILPPVRFLDFGC